MAKKKGPELIEYENIISIKEERLRAAERWLKCDSVVVMMKLVLWKFTFYWIYYVSCGEAPGLFIPINGFFFFLLLWATGLYLFALAII